MKLKEYVRSMTSYYKMYYPAGLTKMRVIPKAKPQRKVPLILTSFFFFLTFGFGMNFGATKVFNEKVQHVTKIISTLISLIIIFILHIPVKDYNSDFLWNLTSFLQYICYFISIKTSKQNIWDFLTEVHDLDENINRVKRKFIGVCTWIYALVVYISKWCLVYTCCEINKSELCLYDYIPYYVYNGPSLGVDLVSVVIIVTNTYIYCCVKDLNCLFKKDSNVQLLKRRYIAIADAVERVRPLYVKLYLFELMFELPKMMGLMYNVISFYFQNEDIYSSISEYIYATHIIAHIVTSAAIMQMIRSQMESIDVQLHQLMIDEQDGQKLKQMSQLAAYMKVRKLWRPVAGVVPVDMRLPISALSICATYLIVLAQLTHLV